MSASAVEFPLRRLDRMYVVTVDAADAAFYMRYRWYLSTGGYVLRNRPMVNGVRGGTSYLHRDLYGLSKGDGLHVDHISHDRLDNRRANLQVGQPWENAQNMGSHRDAQTSAHRGVSYDRTYGVWRAEHMLRGERWRARCSTEAEAVAAVVARHRLVLTHD